ncbi:MAG: hypothetical protein V4510_07490 [bacterium]
MGEKSHTGLYVAIGTLAAIGAGYVIWRYVLSDQAKERAKDAVVHSARKVRGTGRNVADEMPVSR